MLTFHNIPNTSPNKNYELKGTNQERLPVFVIFMVMILSARLVNSGGVGAKEMRRSIFLSFFFIKHA